MSSSKASQCSPFLLNSTCARCSGAASSKRGNHASGAAMVRPSDRLTHRVSSSNRTALGEVLIPSPFNEFLVGGNDASQLPQRACVKTVTVGQVNRRREPEFCLTVRATYMDVHRLTRIALVGVKEKPETFVAEHDRHGNRPLRQMKSALQIVWDAQDRGNLASSVVRLISLVRALLPCRLANGKPHPIHATKTNMAICKVQVNVRQRVSHALCWTLNAQQKGNCDDLYATQSPRLHAACSPRIRTLVGECGPSRH